MAIVIADLNAPRKTSITAALVSLIKPGDDVRVIWVRPTALVYFFYALNPDDGDTVAGAMLTERWPVLANEAWPVPVVTGMRIGIYSDTGTVPIHVFGIRGVEE